MDWKFILAIFLLPLVALKKILPKLLSRPGFILIIIIAVVIGITSQLGGGKKEVIETPAYASNIPTREQAPVVVYTSSRQYYVKNYSDNDQVVTLVDYYWYNNGEWEKGKVGLPLDRKVYGTIIIKKR